MGLGPRMRQLIEYSRVPTSTGFGRLPPPEIKEAGNAEPRTPQTLGESRAAQFVSGRSASSGPVGDHVPLAECCEELLILDGISQSVRVL